MARLICLEVGQSEACGLGLCNAIGQEMQLGGAHVAAVSIKQQQSRKVIRKIGDNVNNSHYSREYQPDREDGGALRPKQQREDARLSSFGKNISLEPTVRRLLVNQRRCVPLKSKRASFSNRKHSEEPLNIKETEAKQNFQKIVSARRTQLRAKALVDSKSHLQPSVRAQLSSKQPRQEPGIEAAKHQLQLREAAKTIKLKSRKKTGLSQMMLDLLERTKIRDTVTIGKATVSRIADESAFYSVEHRKVGNSPQPSAGQRSWSNELKVQNRIKGSNLTKSIKEEYSLQPAHMAIQEDGEVIREDGQSKHRRAGETDTIEESIEVEASPSIIKNRGPITSDQYGSKRNFGQDNNDQHVELEKIPEVLEAQVPTDSRKYTLLQKPERRLLKRRK